MNEKKSFLVYYDNEVIICQLEDDEAGQLFKSLFPYGKKHIRPDFSYSPALTMAFEILSMAMDRDLERYKKTCERNAANARKRWDTTAYDRMPSDATAYETYDRIRPDAIVYDRMRPDAVDADRDMDKDMDMERDKGKERDRVNYQQIADLYNDTCVSLPRVTTLSEARKKAIRARLNTYSLDDFKRLFELAESSSFLKGQNSRNWSANFDWLIKDANMAKVLDGQYSDTYGSRGNASPAVAPVQQGNRFNNFTPRSNNNIDETQRQLFMRDLAPEYRPGQQDDEAPFTPGIHND